MKTKVRHLLLGFIPFFIPAISLGCTVCFGGDDSNLRQGFFWGIVVLGALPFVLIGSFVGTLVWAHRKKNNHAN